MEEIWKDILGYEGLYQVSNHGRVYSLRKNKYMKPFSDKAGYIYIVLNKNKKVKRYSVHRLVAKMFIPNINGLPCVNHMDENKSNNHVSNLEWCTYAYNNSYGTRLKRISNAVKGEKHHNYGKYHTEETRNKMRKNHANVSGRNNPMCRKVRCITTGEIFEYIGEAVVKYKVETTSISACCRGRQSSAGKHPITGEKLVWEYIS